MGFDALDMSCIVVNPKCPVSSGPDRYQAKHHGIEVEATSARGELVQSSI